MINKSKRIIFEPIRKNALYDLGVDVAKGGQDKTVINVFSKDTLTVEEAKELNRKLNTTLIMSHKSVDMARRQDMTAVTVRRGKGNTTENANKHGGSDNWLTPKHILEALGKFDLDPCTPKKMPWSTAKTMLTEKDDGLKANWKKSRVFLNPPYSEVSLWTERMANHGKGIALVAARVDTIWFHEYVFKKAHSILFLKGRLRFCDIKGKPSTVLNKKGKMIPCSAGFPSVLISYSVKDTAVLKKANKTLEGKLVVLDKG